MLTQSMINSGTSRHPAIRVTRPVPAVSPRTANNALELMGAPMPFCRNSEIYGANEPAEYLYKVISGTVRTYKVLNDGRRQIGSFYSPGDMFGLEIGEEHTFSAEAIVDSKVLVIKRSTVIGMAARDNDIARLLWKTTADELQRVQDHIMLLVKTAQERVAGFLLEMAARGDTGDEIELPMSRQDIADYLGLTIETVSRTLTQLENSAAISVMTSRRIVLHKRAALKRMNS